MKKVIYYSRGSLFPALLCAEKHRRPYSTLEQAVQRVRRWQDTQAEKKSEPRLLPYNDGASPVALYALAATAPPELVERTLLGLFCLQDRRRAPAPFILVSLRPIYRESRASEQADPARSGRRLKKLWPEITAAVQLARLQIELMDKLK